MTLILIILHFLFLSQDDLARSTTSAAGAETLSQWHHLASCTFVAAVDILATGVFSSQSPSVAPAFGNHLESILAPSALIQKLAGCSLVLWTFAPSSNPGPGARQGLRKG